MSGAGRLCLRGTRATAAVAVPMFVVLGGFSGQALAASRAPEAENPGTKPIAKPGRAKPAPAAPTAKGPPAEKWTKAAKALTSTTGTTRPPRASTEPGRARGKKPVAQSSRLAAPRAPSVPAGKAGKAGKKAVAQGSRLAAPAASSAPARKAAAQAVARADRLETADDFAVLAGSTITNAGATTIEGDAGLHPGSSITGFAPCAAPAPANCVTLTGATHVADGVALQAQADLLTAYNGLVAQESTCTPVDVALATDVYLPGVYCSPGTFNLAAGGSLTLDAQGDPDAEFIFLTGAGGSTLVTGSGSQVILIGSAQACNVYWQVASSATIGVGSAFVGNILAAQSIQLQTAATLQGSALAQTGAVTLDTNTITRGACVAAAIPPVAPPAGPQPPATPGPNPEPPVTGPTTPTPVGTTPGGTTLVGTPGGPTTGLTTTGLTTTGLTTTGLTTTGRTGTGTGLTGQGRTNGPSLPATGTSIHTDLLLAGTGITLGSLLVRLSRLPRRRSRRS